jgi:hypothetical protein
MTLAMDVDWSRKKLVTASWDYNVDMWDLQTGWAWGLSYWRRNKWEMFEMFEQFAGDLMGKYCDRICLKSQRESEKNHALEAVFNGFPIEDGHSRLPRLWLGALSHGPSLIFHFFTPVDTSVSLSFSPPDVHMYQKKSQV